MPGRVFTPRLRRTYMMNAGAGCRAWCSTEVTSTAEKISEEALRLPFLNTNMHNPLGSSGQNDVRRGHAILAF